MTLIRLASDRDDERIGAWPEVLCGCPAVRLWRTEGEIKEAVEDRQINDRTPKRWFRLDDKHARSSAVPLGGVIWLNPTENADDAKPITRHHGQIALADILRQTFDFTAPDRPWMIRRFRNAGALLKGTPFYIYRYQRSADGEPTHLDGLTQWLREITLESAF